MNRNTIIKSFLIITISAGILSTVNSTFADTNAVQKTASQQIQTAQGIYVKPLTVVNSPKTYLNKSIIMNAKFDKFSTLGLDYKPAYKSSNDYISFLIKRDDTTFNIPLSELKLFIKRSVAENFIDLKTGDEIEIKGVVFSDALGDTWVDVDNLKIVSKAPEDKK